MPTLTFRLSAPMQSWGTSISAADRIGTEMQPTKSGIVGLLAAAEGRARGSNRSDLVSLRSAVRTERPGVLIGDFHTARFPEGEDEKAEPTGAWRRHCIKDSSNHTSVREYLADAIFLVGLEGDRQVLQRLHAALIRPAWPLYLGRRCCVADPMHPQIHDGGLDQVMEEHEWTGDPAWEHPAVRDGQEPVNVPDRPLLLLIDKDESGRRLKDVPLDTTRNRRTFGYRNVERRKVMPRAVHESTPDTTPAQQSEEFDPMALLQMEVAA